MKTNDKNSKKRAAPPRYDEAFRAGAVRMVTEQGRPSKEVAQELGICIDTLRSWLKAAGVQMGQADRQNRNARRERELEAEVRALRKKLADKDEVETLIFDEIDTGISGRTAQKVSEKMALLGKRHQVLCITHLAQIAAMADAHYLIEKQINDNKTTTEIRLLGEDDSIQELSRILGGAKITEAVQSTAKEMKKLAENMKSKHLAE